jgi:alpha-ribazole phosphatase
MIDSSSDAFSFSGVFAVRHAPTLADGLCVGDAEIAPAMTAENAAAHVATLMADDRPTHVWSSPRLRCLEPARVLAWQLGRPLEVDDRLREICLGIWQGQSWADIEQSDPVRFHNWMSNWTDSAPPGGETTMDLLLRVRSWWNELPRGRHLLVAHAGVIRALRVIVLGDSWLQAMRQPAPFLQGQWFAHP